MIYRAEILGKILEVNDKIVKIGEEVFDLSEEIKDTSFKVFLLDNGVIGLSQSDDISIRLRKNYIHIVNNDLKYCCLIRLKDMKYYIETDPMWSAENEDISDNLENRGNYMQKITMTKSARKK